MNNSTPVVIHINMTYTTKNKLEKLTYDRLKQFDGKGVISLGDARKLIKATVAQAEKDNTTRCKPLFLSEGRTVQSERYWSLRIGDIMVFHLIKVVAFENSSETTPDDEKFVDFRVLVPYNHIRKAVVQASGEILTDDQLLELIGENPSITHLDKLLELNEDLQLLFPALIISQFKEENAPEYLKHKPKATFQEKVEELKAKKQL